MAVRGRLPLPPPAVLVYNTNNTSQSCFRRGELLTKDDVPGGSGEALALAARNSFMDGWQIMAFVTCGISVIGAFLILKFMPARHQ